MINNNSILTLPDHATTTSGKELPVNVPMTGELYDAPSYIKRKSKEHSVLKEVNVKVIVWFGCCAVKERKAKFKICTEFELKVFCFCSLITAPMHFPF